MLISVTISGVTPLILDRFTNAALEARTAGTTNQKTDPTPQEQAKAKLYLYDADHLPPEDVGCPYIPVSYVFSAIVEAGRFIKVGKRQLSTRDQTIVPSFLSIVGTDFPIRSKAGWRVDARGIVNQLTKARVMCYRPIFDDWSITFILDVDLSETRINTVRELVDRAGKAVGIGVMRPSRKGPFGIFKVVHWQVIDDAKPLSIAAE